MKHPEEKQQERALQCCQSCSEKLSGLEWPWASGCSTAERTAVVVLAAVVVTQGQYLREVGTWEAGSLKVQARRDLGRSNN